MKPRKVLVLGSGAISIGQAGEFDYSGSQAIKALKEEGVRTVLVNPNIATIQTSEGLADRVYFTPITARFIEKVIEKERPDAVLLSFGGQTALNVGLELAESGVLERNKVRVLGTPLDAIRDTEDRERFVRRLSEIGLKTPECRAVSDLCGAKEAAEEIGYPVMCRIAYALGGLGSGLARDEAELAEIAGKALSHSSQMLVEEYLGGWKEFEYEVMRDAHDNCIVVCSMENLDPMGIHTGESIVVAPVQTLSSPENFMLRSISIKAIRHLGIVGECNIQFAFNPGSDDYRIIEVNARLSRSSALASKATGYPLAYFAAKLAIGLGLQDLRNAVTSETSACFEPALDYIVLKHPRWDMQKFRGVSQTLGSEMKSVGEVMAIGRSFEEVLQKAVRMLDTGLNGLVCNEYSTSDLRAALREPTDRRMLAVALAFSSGMTVEEVHELTRISPWFLHRMMNIVRTEERLRGHSLSDIPGSLLLEAKRQGFSDRQISICTGSAEEAVRAARRAAGISPFVKQIDTTAAEHPARTNYLYMTYNGSEDDIPPGGKGQILVLGGGPYRIGSSVEFDWCCVNCISSLSRLGHGTVVVNCNPETVSTDYDMSQKLYFEEITLERVLDIYERESPIGVIVSVGGQAPNNLALPLERAGAVIIGTSPSMIDMAEDRHKFSGLCDKLGIDQPPWSELTDTLEAERFAEEVGYPVVVRPSYVLSGAAMSIALNRDELREYLTKASAVCREHPVVISKFIEGAKELEMDAVAESGKLVCYAISEHVENAGVHSGDATIVLPPQRTYLETMRRIKSITRKLASALEINGPFNLQLVARDNEVKVIECNLRASRSFPFASKVFRVNFIDEATRAMLGIPARPIDKSAFDLDYVGVKAPKFSFTRLKGSDPVLRVEMASTGEVACLGDSFDTAFLMSLLSVGFSVPERGALLSTGPLASKAELLEHAKMLHGMGLKLYATSGTAEFLLANAVPVEKLLWPHECGEPNTLTYIKEGKVDLVINIPKSSERLELDNDYLIRRTAADLSVPLITNLQLAKRFIEVIGKVSAAELEVKAWDEFT
jgi:carbamoyl-phosphate synthase large subunit